MAWWVALSAIAKGIGAKTAAGSALGKVAKIGGAISQIQSGSPEQKIAGIESLSNMTAGQAGYDQAEATMAHELKRNQMMGGNRRN